MKTLTALLLGFLLLAACTPAAPAEVSTATPAPQPTDTPTLPPPSPTPSPTPTDVPTVPVTLTRVHMLDRTNGWGFGIYGPAPERVLRTEDGGLTWQDVTPPEAPSDRADAVKRAIGTFLDDRTAWITYQFEPFFYFPATFVVWRTSDGGQTWTASEPAEVPALAEFLDLSDFAATGGQAGYFLAHIGAGMNHDYLGIYRTTTAGQSWSLVADPDTAPDIQGCNKTALALANADTGWLSVDCQGVVDRPFIFSTVDGGVSWSREDLPAPDAAPELFERAFCGVTSPRLFSPDEGRIVLRCPLREDLAQGQDFLYRTQDGGASWSTSPYPGGVAAWLDPAVGWAFDEQIHRTLDGGQTWTEMSTVGWEGRYSFVDRDAGWVVADREGQLTLWSTTNGGQNWTQLKPEVLP